MEKPDPGNPSMQSLDHAVYVGLEPPLDAPSGFMFNSFRTLKSW